MSNIEEYHYPPPTFKFGIRINVRTNVRIQREKVLHDIWDFKNCVHRYFSKVDHIDDSHRTSVFEFISNVERYYFDLIFENEPYTEEERSRKKLLEIKDFLGCDYFYSILGYFNTPSAFVRLGPRRNRNGQVRGRKKRRFIMTQSVHIMNDLEVTNGSDYLPCHVDISNRVNKRYWDYFTGKITAKEYWKMERTKVKKQPLSRKHNFVLLERAFVYKIKDESKISLAGEELNLTDTLSEIGICSETTLEYSGKLPINSVVKDNAIYMIHVHDSTRDMNVSVEIDSIDACIGDVLLSFIDTSPIKTHANDVRVKKIVDSVNIEEHYQSMLINDRTRIRN